MTPPSAKNTRNDVDPIDVAVEQLEAHGRSLLTLKALAEAVGMNAPALIKHHGRLDDLLDEADVRRFTRAGRTL